MTADDPAAVDPSRSPGPLHRARAGVSRPATRAVAKGLLRVPEITAFFWVIKGLSTALGEATSDYLVHAMAPVVAVMLGFAGFLGALWYQLSRRRYVAVAYWIAVVMVGVFGTMAADVLHVGFHVPYLASSFLYATCLAIVFVAWRRSEQTLSIHTIDSLRREGFYWAAVVSTFAAGTAVGDLVAITLHLGYGRSLILFVVLILATGVGFACRKINAITAFWIAYVLTRPLGASVADYLGKPRVISGRGIGDGPVCLVLLLAIVILVSMLSVTKLDVQERARHRANRSTAGTS
ncbi:MAG TPA: hypothetical protein VIJ34_11980 [Acidimicrobiales bacterium]